MALALVAACCICLFWGGSADAQGVRSGNVRITLSANPSTVPADGKSRARIRIEVRDRADQPLADGTPIVCHVDNGLLSTGDTDKRQSLTVPAEGGYATVFCTSEEAGGGTVTVRVQESRQRVTVQFVPKGEALQGSGRVINLRGGWIGYCLDLGLIRARDGARAQLGKLVFDAADGIELDIERQTIRGWGVRIKRKGESLQGEDFYYELAGRRGVLRRFGEYGVERVFFSAYNLSKGGLGFEVPDDAFRSDKREGMTWLVCQSCSYFLGQKVVVKHAALYADTQKVFSFPPYWVIGLPGYSGASNTKVLGLSTAGGLAVDFPFFYRVTNEWAGSVKLQRGAPGTSFIARDGWSIGVAEEYDTGVAKGSFEASGLFSSDWGVEWRDERQLLGGDQGFFNVAWPDHHSLFADASIYHYGDTYRLNVRGQYDSPWVGGEGYRFLADWLTDPAELTDDASYRLGASIGGRKFAGLDDGWVFENELYASMDFDAWRLGRRTRLTPSLAEVYAWDTSEYSANSLRARLRLDHEFGAGASLGLNYYLAYRNGDTSRPGANHLLGLNFTLNHGSLWNLYSNGTWDVTAGDTYGYFGFDWFFRPKLRFGLIGTHYDFDDIGYNDIELELARSFGSREIGVRYSFDTGRLSLELGSLGL